MRVIRKQKLAALNKIIYNIPFHGIFRDKQRYISSRQYARMTSRRRTLSNAASLLVLLFILPVFFNIKISADPSYDDWTQTTWQGGKGTDDASHTKYSDISYLSSETPGEINFGGLAAPDRAGSLTSSVFDMGDKAYFGNVTFTLNDSTKGTATIQVRSDSKADMSTASNWTNCKVLSSGESIYGKPDETGKGTNGCVKYPEKYLQYRITLTYNSSPADFAVTDVTLQYNHDSNGPRSGVTVLAQLSPKVKNTLASTYTWSQQSAPSLGWYDEDSGVAGVKYCVGDALNGITDPFQYCNPSSHPERYVGPNGVKPDGTLRYAAGTPEYIADVFPTSDQRLTTDQNYPSYADYLSGAYNNGLFIVFIQAVDNVGNFSISSENIYSSFFVDKFTTLASGAPQEVTATNTVPGTNMFSFEWKAPGATDVPFYKYYDSLLQAQIDDFIASTPPDELLSAVQDIVGDPTLTKEQIPEAFASFKASQLETVNSMIDLFSGSNDEMYYCYKVNSSPDPDDANYDPDWVNTCTRTSVAGVTELPADSYGLKQGINTLYMTSINEAGNIAPISLISVTEDVPVKDKDGNVILKSDGEPYTKPEPVLGDDDKPIVVSMKNYSSTEFEVKTYAPDAPRNIEVTDISNRTASIWRVVLSWMSPIKQVPAIKQYEITRSIDNSTWEHVGYTDSLSYVDTSPELNNQTKYYYQIKSCDNADSCSLGVDAINIASRSKSPGITPNGHYTDAATLTSSPTMIKTGTKRAVINWQTNRESDSAIFISTKPDVSAQGDYSAGNNNQVFSHELGLDNLQPGTKYYYKVTWTDIDNNTGISPEMSFTTLSSPLFSEVGFSKTSIDSTTINFTVANSSNVVIYYGKTEFFGGAKTINTSTAKSTYSIGLDSLDDGTKYFVKINGFDGDGNEYKGSIYSFTTLPRPRISNLAFQPVADASSNTTKVSWTTNVPTTSELGYNISGSDQSEVIDSKLVTEHEITLSNLIDDQTYFATARSRDALGNLATSDTQSFKTALDTRPPKISSITVETSIKGSGAEARGQVIVSWSTDEPATSQVAYGQGAPGAYSNKTAEDSRLTQEHTVVISDLPTSSIYQVQPLSKDKAANESKGTNQSAIIGRASEDVFSIIFNSLRKIFGIKD